MRNIFAECCGFPFVETSLGGDGSLRTIVYVNGSWGYSQDEEPPPGDFDFLTHPTPDSPFTDYDRIDIRCVRCGKSAVIASSHN